MQVRKTWIVLAFLVLLLLFSGVFTALFLDTDFGKIEVNVVSIKDGPFELSGLFYKPKSAMADNPAPAVVLAHGIGGSKEMMSSIGLELARKGFVSLCLDLYGHGKSQGTVADGRKEPSFGVCSAINYLKLKPYVNSSALVLLGHSLGAGAVRAAVQSTDAVALILIAGGLGEAAESPEYAALNSTFPKNLLIIVGKYDVFLDTKELMNKVLPPVFGVKENVVSNMLYGDFSLRTARKFVLPITTHLFEPLDSTVIFESIDWVEKSVGKTQATKEFVYLQRELSILIALVGMLGLPVLALHAGNSRHKQSNLEIVEEGGSIGGKWRLYLVWGVINLALFIPLFIVGLAISFPPLIFGSSVAWWLLVSGLAGLLLLAKFPERIIGRKFVLKELSVWACAKKDLLIATSAFLILFAGATAFTLLLNFNFRIIIPVLTNLSSVRRVFIFAAFVPFFLPYFTTEGLYLHNFAPRTVNKQAVWLKIRLVAEKVLCKIAILIVLLFIQYTSKVTLDFWLIPSFFGFLFEFLWLIVPIFTITIAFSTWFYEKTGNLFSGVIFNTLLTAWIASAIFPF